MAAGCSADVSDPQSGEAQIGSTSEALTAVLGGANDPTNLTDGTGGTTDERVGFASACTLTATVNNVTSDYIIRAGGFGAAAAAKNQIVVFKKGSAPSVQAATLSQANGAGTMVKFSSTECAYVGGASVDGSGVATPKVDLLALSFPGGVPTVTVTNKHDLNEARSNHILGTCTDSNNGVHLWALGGQDSGTGSQSLEISQTNLANAWTKTNTALRVDRMNFGADIDNARHIMAGGGRVLSTGNRDQSLDLIVLDSNCAFSSTTGITTAGKILPSVADGNVIWFDGSNFVSAVGAVSGSTLETKVRTYTVSFSGTPSVTSVSDVTSPSGFTSTYRPYFIRKNTSDIFLIGGANAAINASIATVQKSAAGTWTSQTANAGMYGAVGGYLPNASELWAIDGYSTAPSTLGVTVDAFTD
jgi:hypothetical protein